MSDAASLGTKTDTAGVNSPDRAWEASSETALVAYHSGAFDACARACRAAAAHRRQLAPNDPRQACTSNNLGMAALLAGDRAGARGHFLAAGRAWRQARSWVAGMAMESGARSSLFHMRLEQRHRHAFDPILRARQLSRLSAARAASLFNRALAESTASAPKSLALERAVGQRMRALGPRNPEAAQMLRLHAGLAEARGDRAAAAECRRQADAIERSPARPDLDIWHQASADARSDSRRLLAAVHLTLVATPEAFRCSTNPRKRETVRAGPTSDRGRASP